MNDMRRSRGLRMLMLWCGIGLGIWLPAWGQNLALPPDVTATGDELDYLAEEQLLIYRGGVTITYQDVRISADVVQLQTETLDLEAMGSVRFQRGNDFVVGEKMTGNLRAKRFEFERFDGQFARWQFQGSQAERQEDGSYAIEGAALTTCDDWWLSAQQLKHEPNGDFTARHVTWKVFGVPLLYLPYLSGNTREWNADYYLSAGHKSDWGYYLSLGRHWDIGRDGDTLIWTDLRTERGIAIGNEGELTVSDSFTEWHLYGMHDEDPPTEFSIGDRDYHNRFETEEDRYRLHLFHHYRPVEDVSFMLNIDYLSDNDMLLEFYDDIYNTYREPPSFLYGLWQQDRFDVSIMYQPRINDFFTTVEQLPELRLDMPRQQLFSSNVYYQSETSWAILRTNWREYDLPRRDRAVLDDYATWRFDTAHFLYYPLRIDWLNVVPRAGVRYTYYDETSAAPVDQGELNLNAAADFDRARITDTTPVTNYLDGGGSAGRTLFELGLETSFKTSRTWFNHEVPQLGLDGLRHIAEPYMNYTFISNPDEDHDNLYWFDEIDRIDDVNFVRVGIQNRLQTRRHKRIYTFLRTDTFVDYYISPETDQPEAGDIGQSVEFAPKQGLVVNAKVLVDYDNWDTSVIDAGVRLGDIEKLAVRIGYLFRDKYQTRYNYSMGSDLTSIGPVYTNPTTFGENHNIRITFDWQVAHNTHLQTEHYFDLDQGELTAQSYELSREFRCWITSLKVEEDGENVNVLVVLTMKGVGHLRAGG